MYGNDWMVLNKIDLEAILIFKHLPEIGSTYRSSNGQEFKVLKLAHVEHDAWIEYQNVKTKVHYSCRLPAFLDRFTVVSPYKPWLTR